jgi:glutathione S-transferase
MSLTFYYGSGSPYAWKVWLTLEHKAIPYEFRLLSFDRGDTKAPAFLAVNPRGRVPTIVDDGFALWESGAIVEYLEERYAQNPLLPKDAKGRANARRLAAEADSYLGPVVGKLAELALYSETPVEAGEIDKAKNEILAELASWEREMTGPYFLGALSLADFAVFASPATGFPMTACRRSLRPGSSRSKACPITRRQSRRTGRVERSRKAQSAISANCRAEAAQENSRA